MSLRPRRVITSLRTCAHGGINHSELKARGIDVKNITDFSVSTNPFMPPPIIKQILSNIPIEQYPDSQATALREKLAERLGVSLESLPIEEIFSSFLSSLEPVFRGRDPDITEENLQARIRGSLLMAYSNKFGSLLLATGNKSELATGYCTLYGDMNGGLAVIGDLFKTEVYELARYINRNAEVIPESVIAKPPSAELRPDQRDEDSLPPYDTLDRVLSLYLLENLTLDEIVARGLPKDVVSQVLRMVGRAEYKRRQAPPVLKVSSRAFGTGRRMPIARHIFEV